MPLEPFCGEESRFLDELSSHATFTERKCVAARFLATIVDVLYRSNCCIDQQPLNVSIQLLVIPYLRSNSLHQRLGIMMLLNNSARAFRRAAIAQKQQVGADTCL